MRWLFLALVLSALFVPARAATAQERQVLGTVEVLEPQRLRVRTADGELEEFVLDAQTRYERDGKAAAVGDLQPGMRVVVEAEGHAGMLQARTIRIGVKESEVHAGSHAESDSH